MPLLDVQDILAIGCDHDVEYFAKDLDDTPLSAGSATYELIKIEGDVETVVDSGNVPYTGTDDPVKGAQYKTVIESTVTSALARRGAYAVRVTFVDGGFNDVIQIDYKADYKRG